MEVETLNEIREWAYIIFPGILAVLLYSYIYHLYSSEKSGEADYEKYANLALDDNIDSTPIETAPARKEKKEDDKGANV